MCRAARAAASVAAASASSDDEAVPGSTRSPAQPARTGDLVARRTTGKLLLIP